MERTLGIWGIPCNHVTYVMIQKSVRHSPSLPYRVHKFRYNILFTFLMDWGRAPNGIGHLMTLMAGGVWAGVGWGWGVGLLRRQVPLNMGLVWSVPRQSVLLQFFAPHGVEGPRVGYFVPHPLGMGAFWHSWAAHPHQNLVEYSLGSAHWISYMWNVFSHWLRPWDHR